MCAMINKLEFITPDWCAPPGVHAVCTTRQGGVSAAPFDALNLATHVQDSIESVHENRRRLRAVLALPAEPFWLNQVHGTNVARASAGIATLPDADAAFTDQPNTVLAILTADCLSVIFARYDGSAVAAAHAGWRGLAAGVLEATLAQFQAPAHDVIAWIGPAIGPAQFEVGADVRSAFTQSNPEDAIGFTASAQPGKYYADLFLLARLRLVRAGVRNINGGGLCTASDPARFFSYRRDHAHTGRMATLIWITPKHPSAG